MFSLRNKKQTNRFSILKNAIFSGGKQPFLGVGDQAYQPAQLQRHAQTLHNLVKQIVHKQDYNLIRLQTCTNQTVLSSHK